MTETTTTQHGDNGFRLDISLKEGGSWHVDYNTLQAALGGFTRAEKSHKGNIRELVLRSQLNGRAMLISGTGDQSKQDTDLVSEVMLWLVNVTPTRVAQVYGIKYTEGEDDWEKCAHGYLAEKFKRAVRNPAAWYLDLDIGNRARLVDAVKRNTTR